jgi:hypothetical protein
MTRGSSDKPESYRTAATLFAFSGLVFILVAAVSRKVGVFLPVGIALIVLSMGFWQRSRMPTNGEGEDSSE